MHGNGDDPVHRLLTDMASALARQQAVLSGGDLDQLGPVNAAVDQCFQAIGAWPGGEAGLKDEIASRPEGERLVLRARLQALSTANQTNGELIRISLARVAAFHAFRSANAASGTYGPGAGQADAGVLLSRRA